MTHLSGWLRTVDGRTPASPEKPQNDDSPANANQQWFQPCAKWISQPSTVGVLFRLVSVAT